MSKVRVRFAPSPTGFAHIGNIRTAVFDWLLRQHYGGEFLLRIEDTDRARLVPGAIEEIHQSLEWLGTLPDEGPGIGGESGPYVQSERREIYLEYGERLVREGSAYRCFCTSERLAAIRQEQESRKASTGYDRACLALAAVEAAARAAAGEPHVIRFRVPSEGTTVFRDMVRGDISFENRLLDDFVIVKSDGFPTYHFASVVDDHLMEITHVIRAEEWISSTPKHELLYKALGWTPPHWVHPPLILGPDKSKLSKRHGAVRFLDYRERGFLPEAMMNFIALLGWSPGDDSEILSEEELIRRFSIEGIVNHPVVFDVQKAEWMNGVYIRGAEPGRITELCLPYLQAAGLVKKHPGLGDLDYVRRVTGLVQDRMKLLADVTEMTDFFFSEEIVCDRKGLDKYLSPEYVPGLLTALAESLSDLDDWSVEQVERVVRQTGEVMDVSGGRLVHPVRMAVTGRTMGPGLFETMSVLGRERVLHRLDCTLRTISDSVSPRAVDEDPAVG